MIIKKRYRSLKREDISDILQKRIDNLTLRDLPDPMFFDHMDIAVKRILKAIKNREKISVIGDYDVDGVSSVVVIRKFFSFIGVDIRWYIPNRFEDGYGLSVEFLKKIDKANLVITVDNGIASVDAARYCKENGIDLIITDHHNVPETVPDAYAVIDPKKNECDFPYKEICGAQIAWYLCAALNRAGHFAMDMKTLLDYVALAIVADIMPLTGINRAMLKSGLKILNNKGKAYISVYSTRKNKKKILAEDIAFGLAPLLNSAGRMESASYACEFLCASTVSEAEKYMNILEEFNQRRKKLESEITEEATQTINEKRSIIVSYGKNWHEGVLGIVASRLARRYGCPALVLSEKNGVYKGSGRSCGNFDLFDLLSEHRYLMEKFGGHSNAVGLSVNPDLLKDFIDVLEREADIRSDFDNMEDETVIGELKADMIDIDLYNLLEKYEPYGYMNPRPRFISRNLKIVSSSIFSKNFKRYIFESDGRYIHAVDFGMGDIFETGKFVDLTYTVVLNEYGNETTVQLLIEDIEIST